MVSLSTIRQTLADPPVRLPAPSPSLAAVAMVLAGAPEELELCFILRATRPGDRWSGQMAFPGGRAEPTDPTAQAVAIRESREEVGLQLEHAELIGALASVPVRPAGNLSDLLPFAFYVGAERPPLRPNEEVAETYWIPLRHLWDPQQRDTVDWEHDGRLLRFPGIRYREHIIWGLTYRVLAQWGARLGQPLPEHKIEVVRG